MVMVDSISAKFVSNLFTNLLLLEIIGMKPIRKPVIIVKSLTLTMKMKEAFGVVSNRMSERGKRK